MSEILEEQLREKLRGWIKQDSLRMQALKAVAELNLSNAYIAAGFVRNLIWDKLHHFKEATPLNDVDVIYFNLHETLPMEKHYQDQLSNKLVSLNWQVKNQATIYLRHQHLPYTSILDAMSYWPEQETAIGIRLDQDAQLEIVSVFPLAAIFEGYIRHNPKVPLHIFQQRLADKQWQKHWFKLKV